MKIEGIELLQMIKDGKLKADTEIKVWFDDGIKKYITTLYFNGLDLKWQPETFYARYFYSKYIEFEIIEDEEEFEDIEDVTLNGKEVRFGSLSEWADFKLTKNEIKISSCVEGLAITMSKLIKNQKKIIEKLKSDKNE